MPRKKKFIDKKKAVTFHLVHRSQRDPLQANEDAGQRVLLEAAAADPEKRKEAQREYGVYFDDEYDYLQHLRDVDELNDVGFGDEPVERFRVQAKKPSKPGNSEPRLKLPSTVFGTDVEQEVGMLNKAAPVSGPKLDWDPDIVAGLDEDFDYDDPENILDDDFMVLANADKGTAMEEEDYSPMSRFTKHMVSGDDDEDSEDDDDDDYVTDEDDMEDDDIASDEADEGASDIGSLDDRFSFADEETKSRFTQYSVSSSVIRRNQGLTLLDERFEKFFEQYDEEELGAIDHEDIDGCVNPNSEVLTAMMDEFTQQQNRPKLKDVIEKVADLDMDSKSEDERDEFVKHTEPAKEQWDCESILSTYSNLYNHPTLIREPRKQKISVDEKSGMPKMVAGEGLTLKDIEKEYNRRNKREDKACTYRPDDETTEERKQRKKAIKEERRDRRQEKKATKIAFRKEAIKHGKERINAARNEGVKMS